MRVERFMSRRDLVRPVRSRARCRRCFAGAGALLASLAGSPRGLALPTSEPELGPHEDAAPPGSEGAADSGDPTAAAPVEQYAGIPALEEAMRARAEGRVAEPPAMPDALTTYDRMERYELASAAESATYSSYVASPGAVFADGFLLGTGVVEAGGEMIFVVSDRELAGQSVGFTDLGLLRLRARRSFGRHLELFAATELTVKQPHGLHAPLWQGALGGARVPFARRWAAVVSGAGGPLLDRDGQHFEGGSSLEYKPRLDHAVWLDLELGTATTGLRFRPRAAAPFFLEELMASAAALLGDDDGGGWIAVEYRLPYARSPRRLTWDGAGTRTLDPGPGLGLTLGGALTLDEHGWDLFAVFSVIDRGDAARPETTLPILHGGADALELTLGLQHRFEVVPEPERLLRRIARRRARGQLRPLP